jgi:thiol-disulfide isomerase/thioredoxin
MWSLFTLVAAGADIQDEVDARYLFDSHRQDQATRWFRARMEEQPDDPRWLLGYLRTLGAHPALRHAALLESVQRWTSRHPGVGENAVLLAHAAALEAMDPQLRSSQPWPDAPGPWCEVALGHLAELPDEPALQFRQLALRVRMDQSCRRDPSQDEAALTALGLSGEAGPFARAWVGRRDEDPSGDVEAVLAALEQEPWRLADLHGYASRPDVAEPLLHEARAAAASDRPALVYGASRVFTQAQLAEEARAAYFRLAELDPGHPLVLGWIVDLQRPSGEPLPEEPAPTTLFDPATRLQTLRQQGPASRDLWDRTTYWQAVADAAHGLEQTALQWRALRRLSRLAWGDAAEQQLVQLALETGAVPRAARRAADALVESRRAPSAPEAGAVDPGARWRERLAEALELRAQLHELQGQTQAARRDLEEATLLAGPSAARQLRLGELYAQQGQRDEAIVHLAAGMARAGQHTPQARARLEGLLAGSPWWVPDPDLLVASSVAPPPPAGLDSALFADLEVTVEGEPVRLLDLPGALVVDVWATWCGPCKESLPHLDQLARAYEGQVTFVAVSVDSDAAAAGRYLQARGGGAFVSAHAPGGMQSLGVSGIPALFVFDAQHELIATLSGWGPGDRRLDEVVREVAPR